jgi:GNAT superfamily N-acetyltransferase
MSIYIAERAMTAAEYACELEGFREHALEYGIPDIPEIRYGFVAVDGEAFIGSVSGLLYDKWFYITDLWLAKPYRKQGYGAELLHKMEDKAKQQGVKHIWTWTAGYEAAPFYQKHGYVIFCEFEDYYPTGHSRIGLRKQLYG